MSKAFDPYHVWLGIKPKDQPPNHYRLLGLDLYESDPQVIDSAADRQMSHVRTFQSGPRSEESQKLLNELAAARVCLQNATQKNQYDEQLRDRLESAERQRAQASSGGAASHTPSARPLRSPASSVAPPPPGDIDYGVAPSPPPPFISHSPGVDFQPLITTSTESPLGSYTTRSKTQAGWPILAGIGGAVALVAVVLVMVFSGSGSNDVAGEPGSGRASTGGVSRPPLTPTTSSPPVIDTTKAAESVKQLLSTERAGWGSTGTVVLGWPSIDRENTTLEIDGQVVSLEAVAEIEGEANVRLKLPTGQRRIRISRPDYRPVDVSCNVVFGQVGPFPVVMLPDQPMAPVDLLEMIVPKDHSVAGNWIKTAEGSLVIERASVIGRIAVPYDPPSQYMLTASVEQLGGNDAFNLGLMADGRYFGMTFDGWPFDGWYSAVEFENGRPRDNPAAHIGQLLPSGSVHEITVLVRDYGSRGKHIRTICDGKEVANWTGSPLTLSQESSFIVHPAPTLSIATHTTGYRVSKLELTPLEGGGTAAPTAQHEFRGHRYEFVPRSVTWHEAVKLSHERGGILCCVESPEEWQFLVDTFSPRETWLGGTDAAEEGKWEWITGEPFGSDIKHLWKQFEPNNAEGTEHAIMGQDGTWFDAFESRRSQSFIIEWSSFGSSIPEPDAVFARLRKKPRAGSVGPRFSRGGRSYALITDALSWPDAQAWCREQGGYLCCIETPDERSFLREKLTGQTQLWLGGSDEAAEGRWMWESGTRVDPKTAAWGGAEPNNRADSEHSMEWFLVEDAWNDAVGAREVHFICEWGNEIHAGSLQPPVPDRGQVEQTKTRLRESMQEAYTRAERHNRLGLAAHLIRWSEGQNEPLLRYAALDEAREIAISEGDAALALLACDEISKRYATERLQNKAAALARTAEQMDNARLKPFFNSKVPTIAALAERVVRELAQIENAIPPDRAVELLATLERSLDELVMGARRAKAIEAERTASSAKQAVRLQSLMTNAAGPVLSPAAVASTDPQDAWKAGFFFGLVRGDWSEARKHFGKSNVPAIARASANLSVTAANTEYDIAFADACWDAAGKEKDADWRAILREAARHWYRSAAKAATGEQFAKFQSRLADITEPPVNGPLVVPLNGVFGRHGMLPVKLTGTIAPLPGGYAAVGGSGNIEYECLPTPYFVHELELTFEAPMGRIDFGYGPDDSTWFGVDWNGDKKVVQAVHWESGIRGTWGGARYEFPLGKRFKTTVYGTPTQHVLFIDGKRVMGAGSTARDLRFHINAHDNTRVRIWKSEFRPWTEYDSKLVRKAPVNEQTADFSKTAATLYERSGDLPSRPLGPRQQDFVAVTTGTSMKWIPAGEFDRMASATSGGTRVSLSKGFWIARYELSQAEWLCLADVNPGRVQGSPFLPVDGVSWPQIAEFCRQLNAREQRLGRVPKDYQYRLPTEAEWEYACRAGSAETHSVQTASFWHSGTSQGVPHEVGLSTPNAWELYDMHGNLSEWCLDAYKPLPEPAPGQVVDPWERPAADLKDMFSERGGKWWYSERDCTSNWRHRTGWRGGFGCGFRLVLAPAVK